MNWVLVLYVALTLGTAEFLRRNGVNWVGQTLAGTAWPLYWGHCISIAWRTRRRG